MAPHKFGPTPKIASSRRRCVNGGGKQPMNNNRCEPRFNTDKLRERHFKVEFRNSRSWTNQHQSFHASDLQVPVWFQDVRSSRPQKTLKWIIAHMTFQTWMFKFPDLVNTKPSLVQPQRFELQASRPKRIFTRQSDGKFRSCKRWNWKTCLGQKRRF